MLIKYNLSLFSTKFYTPWYHLKKPFCTSAPASTSPCTRTVQSLQTSGETGQLQLQTAGGNLTLQTCDHMLHTHLRLNYLYPENTKTEKRKVESGWETKLTEHSNGWDQEKSEVETTKAEVTLHDFDLEDLSANRFFWLWGMGGFRQGGFLKHHKDVHVWFDPEILKSENDHATSSGSLL